MKLAIVGKRNAGKSTLINALAGEDRVIVSETPGTTRDSVDVQLEIDGERLTLIDTAGVKRTGKLSTDIEFYSQHRALRSVRRADVIALVIDASLPVSHVDKNLAGIIHEEFKPGPDRRQQVGPGQGHHRPRRLRRVLRENVPRTPLRADLDDDRNAGHQRPPDGPPGEAAVRPEPPPRHDRSAQCDHGENPRRARPQPPPRNEAAEDLLHEPGLRQPADDRLRGQRHAELRRELQAVPDRPAAGPPARTPRCRSACSSARGAGTANRPDPRNTATEAQRRRGPEVQVRVLSAAGTSRPSPGVTPSEARGLVRRADVVSRTRFLAALGMTRAVRGQPTRPSRALRCPCLPSAPLSLCGSGPRSHPCFCIQTSICGKGMTMPASSRASLQARVTASRTGQ